MQSEEFIHFPRIRGCKSSACQNERTPGESASKHVSDVKLCICFTRYILKVIKCLQNVTIQIFFQNNLKSKETVQAYSKLDQLHLISYSSSSRPKINEEPPKRKFDAPRPKTFYTTQFRSLQSTDQLPKQA